MKERSSLQTPGPSVSHQFSSRLAIAPRQWRHFTASLETTDE
ncbi:hypothetical protein [Altericista sp. CCNU0014]